MMQRLRPILAAFSIAMLATARPASNTLRAQAPDGNGALPTTGIDFSGVDQFWKIVDILRRDVEPTDDEWRALLNTPGYRLAVVNLGPELRENIDLTFRPARHAEFERASKGDDDRALQLQHLALAFAKRSEVQAYRDSLARATPIADGVAIAAGLLPRGATSNGAPPFVAFAIFKDDGYSLPDGIVIDLLYARMSSIGGAPLTANLAHEFHHTYVNRLSGLTAQRSMSARMDDLRASPDGRLRQALYDLRNEGIADQIDKPYPFTPHTPGLAGYAAQYNREYARTPDVIRALDSLLTSIGRDSTRTSAVSGQVARLFWHNGHPNGAYIAREIRETFGDDSLRSASLDPATFLRQYAAAERAHGRPAPLSAEAWRVIDRLDARYWRR